MATGLRTFSKRVAQRCSEKDLPTPRPQIVEYVLAMLHALDLLYPLDDVKNSSESLS